MNSYLNILLCICRVAVSHVREHLGTIFIFGLFKSPSTSGDPHFFVHCTAGNTLECEPRPNRAEPALRVDGLCSPLDPVHGLSVHQSESPPSHGSCVLCGGLAFMLSALFSIDEQNRANQSWLGALWLGLSLKCIPSLPRIAHRLSNSVPPFVELTGYRDNY